MKTTNEGRKKIPCSEALGVGNNKYHIIKNLTSNNYKKQHNIFFSMPTSQISSSHITSLSFNNMPSHFKVFFSPQMACAKVRNVFDQIPGSTKLLIMHSKNMFVLKPFIHSATYIFKRSLGMFSFPKQTKKKNSNL